MADKKYYWLKLKRDFFKRHDIQIIEGMPNGKDYILFYLKLLCESVDHNGNLRFSEEIPYNEQMLATITNTNIDVVRSAIKLFAQLKMLEIMDDGTYYMSQVEKMIGGETYWAEKKRQQRLEEGKKEEKLDNVQLLSPPSPKCPSKSKSKSKSIEIDSDKDIESIKYIVAFLNEKADCAYKASSKKTKTLIRARMAEGFTEQDFITVIEKKTAEWKGTDMAQYLRPETLFGTKFESYLNAPVKTNKQRNGGDSFINAMKKLHAQEEDNYGF